MIFLARRRVDRHRAEDVERGPPRPGPRARAPGGAAAPVYTKQVEEILKRNIFCSACPPILGKPEEDTGPPPPPPLQRTALNLKLLAIMFAPPPADPRWSVAIIRDNDAKSAGPLQRRLEAARRHGRRHRRGPRLPRLRRRPPRVPGSARPAAAGAGAPAAAAPAAPTDPLAAELDKGIKKIGEHNYEVQRSTLDSLLGNMGALAKGARIVPETKDGKPAGFRLFSIRPDGPFAKIGLLNGDVVSAINGLEMNSPDQALLAYTKLKTANHLSVAIERNGQKITKDYNIR